MKSYIKGLFFLIACGSIGCGSRGSFEQNINSKSVGETVVELQLDENLEVEDVLDGEKTVDCEALGYEGGEGNEISTSSLSLRRIRSGAAGGHIKDSMLCREKKDKDLASRDEGDKNSGAPMTEAPLKCVKVCDLLTKSEALLSLDRIQTHSKGKSCGEVKDNLQSRLGSCESQNETSDDEQGNRPEAGTN